MTQSKKTREPSPRRARRPGTPASMAAAGLPRFALRLMALRQRRWLLERAAWPASHHD